MKSNAKSSLYYFLYEDEYIAQGFHFYISASLITRVQVQQHYNMFKSVTISLVSYTFCEYHMFPNISDDPLITANHLERVYQRGVQFGTIYHREGDSKAVVIKVCFVKSNSYISVLAIN